MSTCSVRACVFLSHIISSTLVYVFFLLCTHGVFVCVLLCRYATFEKEFCYDVCFSNLRTYGECVFSCVHMQLFENVFCDGVRFFDVHIFDVSDRTCSAMACVCVFVVYVCSTWERLLGWCVLLLSTCVIWHVYMHHMQHRTCLRWCVRVFGYVPMVCVSVLLCTYVTHVRTCSAMVCVCCVLQLWEVCSAWERVPRWCVLCTSLCVVYTCSVHTYIYICVLTHALLYIYTRNTFFLKC